MIKEIKPLWEHQRLAAEKAKDRNDFAFFFEMGAGKTLTAITTLRHVYEKNDKLLKTLIVCPPIVIENWKKEILEGSKIKEWNIVPLVGPQKTRVQTFLDNCFKIDGVIHTPIPRIVLVNYEGLLMIDLIKLLHKWRPEVMVYDESHKCKDHKSKRAKSAAAFSDKARYRYILSGTPVLNSAMDLFSQFLILDKGNTFGKNFFAFRAKYFYDRNSTMPKQKYFPDWRIKQHAEEEINQLIMKKSMRITKAQCMDLPPLVVQDFKVELTTEQRRIYDDMKSDFIAYLGDSACVATLAITKALRLMQIASGFVNVEKRGDDGASDRKNISITDNPRAQALKELLEQITPNAKVLVWAVFKENYDTIRRVCESLELDLVEVHGEISQTQKDENVKRFNTDPKCRVFLGHPGSGGIGINLVAASYSIFYSRNFSLEQDLQAEARNHRGGAEIHEKITRINIIAKDTIDEVIAEALSKKINISEKVLKDMLIKEKKVEWNLGNWQNTATQ